MLCTCWKVRGAELQQPCRSTSPGSLLASGLHPVQRAPCTLDDSTAYLFCVPYLLEAMLTFPDAAGFPAEQGTYTATFGTGPGMRPMPGLRVSGACPLP